MIRNRKSGDSSRKNRNSKNNAEYNFFSFFRFTNCLNAANAFFTFSRKAARFLRSVVLSCAPLSFSVCAAATVFLLSGSSISPNCFSCPSRCFLYSPISSSISELLSFLSLMLHYTCLINLRDALLTAVSIISSSPSILLSAASTSCGLGLVRGCLGVNTVQQSS